MSSLFKKFKEEIVPRLMKERGIENSLAVPRLEKIVINMGVGGAIKDKTLLEKKSRQLAIISGQKPVVTLARKSIAGFKLRKGQPIGLKVTLRGERMYNFFEKLIWVVLPRVKDFQGVSYKSFDGFGNYTLGIKEQIVFPEIESSSVDKSGSLEITIVTTAKNDKEGRELLKALGMPFEKSKTQSIKSKT